jgi:DNA polymerase type B, organellar and viral
MKHSFLVFDTEDDSKELLAAGKSGFDKVVTQIAAITAGGNRFYNRGNATEFLKWLKATKEKFVYAHNLQYDLGNLFGDRLDELDVTMVGGRLIKATWANKVFVDSFNIWPMKLAKIGEAFGIEKLETKSMATDREYVYRDCEILHKAMTFAWNLAGELGIENLPPTLGGLCVKVWKQLGGVNTHDSHVMSREALYGGRVELFAICDDNTFALNHPAHVYGVFNGLEGVDDLVTGQKETICYTDLNSLYPAMMLKEFPGIMEDWTETRLPKFGIMTCEVDQPETFLPILPYRQADGRIIYPCGKFRGTWTIAELNAFQANGGTITKRLECIGTDEACSPYRAFVLLLYEKRLAAKSEAEKLFYKLLMNNLFGRLGTSGVIGRSVWQNDRNKWEGIPYGNKVLVNYHMPLSDETNWSHAAYITAYGRLELHKYLVKIVANRLIYCDTDSAIFNCPNGRIPFTISTDLGCMKLEGWEKACIAFAPKTYVYGNQYKAKGVPKNKQKEFIETGKAAFDIPYKMREAMRFFDRDNAKRLSVWRTVHKECQVKYDRKKLVGNKFYPCTINEI